MSFERVGDLNMYYEIVGSGAPVLLIHGLGSSTRDWEYQIEALGKEHQVIMLDIRGHGQTTKAKGKYSIELFARDIENFLDQMKIGPLHIIGLSMGGMIAFQLALDIPSRIKSITIVNSGPGFTGNHPKLKLKFHFRLLLLRLFGLRAAAKRVAKGLFPNGSNNKLSEIFIERFCQNDKRCYLKTTSALIEWDVNSQIQNITCPTLIIAADTDYTSVESKQEYTDKMPNANLVVVENSHHALPVENPKAFNEIVLDFFKSQQQ